MPPESEQLIQFTSKGIYCPRAGIYIDPWNPAGDSIITHAHSDHASKGQSLYICHRASEPFLKYRLGSEIITDSKEYAKPFMRNGVEISLHPAGHIVGSAQVRLSYKEETWVISGDYKLHPDKLSTPFEPVPCNHFVTESTFGLPVYRWPDPSEVFEEINQWWKSNRENGICSVLVGYALGKAQRILSEVNTGIGPIYVHGAIYNIHELSRRLGYPLPQVQLVDDQVDKKSYRKALVIAAPSAIGSPWMKRFGKYSLAFASGWMKLRGPRRRRAADRGFVLSDHADWEALNKAVKASGAEHIYVTHGYKNAFARWLKEKGYDAHIVETEYTGESTEIGEIG